MKILTVISSVYGQARGYRRLSIRRQVNAHDRLSRSELSELTDNLLQQRLHGALKRFPAYAEAVRSHRGALPNPGEIMRLEELPVWTRDMQRAFFDQQQRPLDSAYVHQTSGSTTLPVNFHVTRESYEWRAAIMDRSYSWAGAEEGRRSFYVWAADHGHPAFSQRLKRRVHTTLQRRVFYDAFKRFGDNERAECCAIINRFRPESIVGYTGMLVDLARYIGDNPGSLTWKPATLVNAAEGMSPGQRKLLEEHLAHEVFLSYGSREFMSIGMECEVHRGYHLTSDNLVVEVVGDDGSPLGPGQNGRILVTDLRNLANPFIRYEIGDYGTMAEEKECPCGRPFPMLASVNGRLQDIIYTPDGRTLTALFISYVMRGFEWVNGWQVVQDSSAAMTVRVLTNVEIDEEKKKTMLIRLREQVGDDLQISIERVDELIRRDSGKIHQVMSSIARHR